MKTKQLLLVLIALFSLSLNAIQTKILFLTDPTKLNGAVQAEQCYVDSLIAHGYAVTTDYTTPFNLSSWGTYDLIIVGRTCSSGNFTDVAAWANLAKPVITINPFILRTDRLKFLNKSSADMKQLATADAITKVVVADVADNAFAGISLPSQKMNMYTGVYEYYDLLYSDWTSTNNGKLLAYLTGDVTNPNSEGKIIAARWKPYVETYPGSGNIPVAYRSFISFGMIGAVVNFANYTAESMKVLLNEVSYLTTPDAFNEIKLTGTLIGTLTAENASPATNAFDGNFSTFFDCKTGTGGWLGYDLGTPRTVSTVKVAPRADQRGRMNGSKIQGANVADFSDAVDLVTIAGDANLPANIMTVYPINSTTAYRYIRYYAPGTWSFCNIAELQFYTRSANIALTGLSLSPNTGSVTVDLELALAPTFTPNDATNKVIAWTSDNTAVATVNSLGVVLGKTPGTAVITGVSNDGSFSISTTITVNAVIEDGTKLTGGMIIGYNLAQAALVFDGDKTTFAETWVNGTPGAGGWYGMDFVITRLVNKIKICPRSGWAGRLGNGRVEASTDAAFTSPVLLYATPNNLLDTKLTTVLIPENTTKYRYFRYLAGDGSWGNIAELEFWSIPNVPTGISTLSTTNLAVYPNPLVSGSATVTLSGYENERNVKLRVIDMNGKEIMSQNINSKSITINRAALSSGLYCISVSSDNGVKNYKLSVK
ncbi:MAG: T9SS type A sorting domain-containing protein [Paludibacter sp.]|nr:T9SS type A sorting domain-containing protein [Paludibacter sp.]